MSNIDENQHDDEEDVQNDAVIASALRASLIVFMLLGLPVIGFLIYLNTVSYTHLTLPTIA